MKIDPQHVLPVHLVFYRRRWFWGVVFGIFFIFSTTLFVLSITSDIQSHYIPTIKQVFDDLNTAYGAGVFRYITYLIIGLSGFYVGSVIYFALIIFLVYKTFHKSKVSVLYPLLLSALYIAGIFPLFFMNGF